MTARYTHLQPEERVTLAALLQQGYSLRSIAGTLGRSPATLSREIARNSAASQDYASGPAQLTCQQRRLNRPGFRGGWLV
ncbi:helix-turn-helix domain-containing protein [Brachymonas denitrificans]|jgi:IS30 family transposase|uniref:helix-turn-helix domain-containing protein n=1 Tax=Brachymonas denitrificans TaxID=28220 RepID=UPI00396A58E6